MSNFETVTLGQHELKVVAQPHARLRHHLSANDFEKVVSGSYGEESYRILCVLIPDIKRFIPEHEWEGFATQEDMKRYREGDTSVYSEEAADLSPSFDAIADAFEAAVKVNGGTRLGKLLGLVTQVTAMQQSAVQAQTSQKESSEIMPASQQPPGDTGA